MRLATIIPVGFAEVCLEQDDCYHLLIAPEVLNNQHYREFYGDRGRARDFIMLDNGAYEAHMYGDEVDLSAEYLKSAVNALGVLPAEIVLPDIPGQAHETLMASTKAAYELKEEWRYAQFMAVPHGVTLEEYLECARYMIEIPGLNSLGVPFIAADALHISRDELVRHLHGHVGSHLKMTGETIQLHLLGFKDPIDPETAKMCRGFDTAKHVRMGLEGKALSVEAPVVECGPRPSDFFQRKPKYDEEVTLIIRNIAAMKEIYSEQ